MTGPIIQPNSILPDSLSSNSPRSAGLQEIFSSIQGEGPYVGKRQVFIRFNGCHLRCTYCDTPAQANGLPCRIEPYSGQNDIIELPNPVALDSVDEWIRQFIQHTPHHSVSLTGGEPLLYWQFLQGLLPPLAGDIPFYLETSGTQPQFLDPLLPWLTYVAMDIKLPSATGEPWFIEEQKTFLSLCQGHHKATFIKLVVNEQTTLDELRTLDGIIGDHHHIPIVLQPVTDLASNRILVPQSHLFMLYDCLAQRYDDVRLIPQTHKMMGLL